MTTIATDGKTMASDTRQGADFIDQVESIKVFRIKGEVVGICGDYAEARRYLEWLQNGSKKDDKPHFDKEADFEALHLTQKGVFSVTKNLYRVATGTPAACGSGGCHAIAAMMAGATPKRAVEISIQLDPFSGGRVMVMKL